MERIKEKDLRNFFQEFKKGDPVLKKSIMNKIISLPAPQLKPAIMPPVLLWGIVITLLGLMSLAFYHSQPLDLGLWGNIPIQWPDIPTFDQVDIHPSLGLSIVALASSVWIILGFQHRLGKKEYF